VLEKISIFLMSAKRSPLKEAVGAQCRVAAAVDMPIHPDARDAYAVWCAVAVADFAPAQNGGLVAAVDHDGEPMVIAGFRAYTAACRDGADLVVALVQTDPDAIAAVAWGEVVAAASLMALPEIIRADFADRLARHAPEAVRRALNLRQNPSLQAVDSRLSMPVRARRALEARRQRPTVIAEALARMGQGGRPE
jgi:hypothetical protein